MIFMLIGVATGVRLVCTALDQLHSAADKINGGSKAVKTARNLRNLGSVIPYRPPIRLYSTPEEGMCGEDEGSYSEQERKQARHRAEVRFETVAKDWPHCTRCGEPVMNPKKYFEVST